MSFISETLTQPETAEIAVSHRRRAWPTRISKAKEKAPESATFFVGLVTSSLTLHLLLVGFLGFGVPQEPLRLPRKASVPATRVTEDVKLEPAPIDEPVLQPRIESVVDSISTPAAPANIDLPTIPQLQPIAAVAEAVPVAFALPVKGPVRVVSNAAAADGAVGGARQSGPVSVDANGFTGRNLLLPPISYPSEAARSRLSGQVEIEFHTSPTGDIYDVRIRQSSGSPILDRAALQNLRSGRWVGEAGYFVKAYSFVLPS